MNTGSNTLSLAARFWPKVKVTPTCWLWSAGTTRPSPNRPPYGALITGPRGSPMMRAHRIAWLLTKGPIPEGLWVLHKCDVSLCCNPDHLFLGTVRDNAADCVAKGRTALGTRNGQYKHGKRMGQKPH